VRSPFGSERNRQVDLLDVRAGHSVHHHLNLWNLFRTKPARSARTTYAPGLSTAPAKLHAPSKSRSEYAPSLAVTVASQIG